MAKKTDGAELACSFCGKRPPQVKKLIAGPGILICSECLARCAEIAREGHSGVQSTTRLTQVPNRPSAYSLLPYLKIRPEGRAEPTCAFCGRPGPDLVQPPSTLGTHALICSGCVALCQDIVRAHAGDPQAPESAMQIAILIIDMQVDFFMHERLARNRARLIANTNHLVRVARENGRPIIWVKTEFAPDLHDALPEIRKKRISVVISGSPGAQFLPELEHRETDTVVVKKRYSAFFGTALEALLRARACSRLIVCGINTHACVRTTVIDAYQRDFEVILAEDCIDSHDAEHHEISWRYMNGKLGEGMSLSQIGALLSQR